MRLRSSALEFAIRAKGGKAPVANLIAATKRIVAPACDPPLNLSLLELGPLQCRAVTCADRFNQRYCGHPVRSGGGCAGHHALFSAPATLGGR
jgi:hypothetical protein